MPKLPSKIRESLKKEAFEWETIASKETVRQAEEAIEQAELFKVERPSRQPVSVRLDPIDISILKRFARRHGISYSQLIAMWLHERIKKERATTLE